MISNILLVSGIGLVVLSYLIILINYIKYKRKNDNDYTGFDIAKEITDNYDSINIVNSSDVIFSEYDSVRNVIRMNNRNYDGNTYFDLAVGAILAGYSLVEQNNNNYFKFNFIIKKIGYLGFVSLFGVILSYFLNNVGDAKIGIVVLGIMIVYQYMKYNINVMVSDIIKENIKDEMYDKVSNVVNSVITFNKLSFITLLVLVVRLVVIIVGI